MKALLCELFLLPMFVNKTLAVYNPTLFLEFIENLHYSRCRPKRLTFLGQQAIVMDFVTIDNRIIVRTATTGQTKIRTKVRQSTRCFKSGDKTVGSIDGKSKIKCHIYFQNEISGKTESSSFSLLKRIAKKTTTPAPISIKAHISPLINRFKYFIYNP